MQMQSTTGIIRVASTELIHQMSICENFHRRFDLHQLTEKLKRNIKVVSMTVQAETENSTLILEHIYVTVKVGILSKSLVSNV